MAITNRLAVVTAPIALLLTIGGPTVPETTAFSQEATRTVSAPTDSTKKTPQAQVASFQVAAPSATSVKPDRSKHPLLPVLELAREGHAAIAANIRDYTCTIVRRERIAGKLGNYEFIDAKIRHQQMRGEELLEPFSVYLNFTKPASVEGREALYVDGENSGKVFVRRGGQRMAHLSTFIKPDSRIAMRDNRYPITDIGFQKLIERLIEVVEHDLNYGECEVTFYENAKVNDRTCTRIEVVHPVERDHFTFHRAMVFVDDQDKLPVGYVSYSWPDEPGGKPVLLEEYVYTNIRLNPGLTDRDFDRNNPDYGFSRSEEVDR